MDRKRSQDTERHERNDNRGNENCGQRKDKTINKIRKKMTK